MATRKKQTKKTPARRRRRVSGIGGGDLINTLAGALGGFVVGNMASGKLFPNLDPKIKGAALAGASIFFLPKLVGNTAIAKGAVLGLALSGGVVVLKSLGVISGIGNKPEMIFLPAPGGQGVNSMVNGAGKNESGKGVSSMVNGRMNTKLAGLYTS
jgi:hypothetical protein